MGAEPLSALTYTEDNRILILLLAIASNGATWAFGGGGGLPMGSGVLSNARPNSGPMTSFAQTIGGSSQPATPLDLS